MPHSQERNLTVPTKAEVSKKTKETFEEAGVILFRESEQNHFLTLLFFLWTTMKLFFFLINKPTNDQFYFFLSKLIYQFTLLRRAMLKNHVLVFIVSFPMSKNNLLWKREMRGSKLIFFLHICPHRACNPTTYILKNAVYAKLKIQDSLQKYSFSCISSLIWVSVTSINFKATHKGKNRLNFFFPSYFSRVINTRYLRKRMMLIQEIKRILQMFSILINHKMILFLFLKHISLLCFNIT